MNTDIPIGVKVKVGERETLKYDLKIFAEENFDGSPIKKACPDYADKTKIPAHRKLIVGGNILLGILNSF